MRPCRRFGCGYRQRLPPAADYIHTSYIHTIIALGDFTLQFLKEYSLQSLVCDSRLSPYLQANGK